MADESLRRDSFVRFSPGGPCGSVAVRIYTLDFIWERIFLSTLNIWNSHGGTPRRHGCKPENYSRAVAPLR